MIRLLRAYEQPTRVDGTRILVERLWPRGLTKERARIDWWAKDVAPSTELRKWFAHDISRWDEFRERYVRELKGGSETLAQIQKMAREGTVTFVYAARDEEHNSARLLKEFLEGKTTHNRAPRKRVGRDG